MWITRFLLCGFLLLGVGCVQTRITEPKRSAVEQLLISTAADNALRDLMIPEVNGKKTFVDSTYFEGQDRGYVIGSIRDLLSRSGGLLVPRIEEAEIIVEPRSGALSIDGVDAILGFPKLPIPVPFTGTLESPELALFKTQKQFSTAKLALLAYEQSSREHLRSVGPLVGRASIKYYKVLGYFKYTKTNIPEKKRQKKK